jgi:hypothetical protein
MQAMPLVISLRVVHAAGLSVNENDLCASWRSIRRAFVLDSVVDGKPHR